MVISGFWTLKYPIGPPVIAASVGSDKNILQSLPSISSSDGNAETSEPSIPENN